MIGGSMLRFRYNIGTNLLMKEYTEGFSMGD